jgi:hypothetical protein
MKEINLKSRQNGETNRKIKGLTLTRSESVAEKSMISPLYPLAMDFIFASILLMKISSDWTLFAAE